MIDVWVHARFDVFEDTWRVTWANLPGLKVHAATFAQLTERLRDRVTRWADGSEHRLQIRSTKRLSTLRLAFVKWDLVNGRWVARADVPRLQARFDAA